MTSPPSSATQPVTPLGIVLITVDGFLVQGVDKVAGILDGVLEVADGLQATGLGPAALLGRLRLILDLTESDLLWAAEGSKNQGRAGLKSAAL